MSGKSTNEDRLIRAIKASLLPGEEGIPSATLRDIGAFVGAAMERRKPNCPVIVIGAPEKAADHTAIAIVNDDMPFLVDSITAAIGQHGGVIDLLLHPIVPVMRDGEGVLKEIPTKTNAAEAPRESAIYIETQRLDAKTRRELQATLESTLGDVRAAVGDWPTMRQAMERDAQSLGESEGAALLRWLEGGMLTLLGHVTRTREGEEERALGICRKSAGALLAGESYDRAFAWFDDQGAQATADAPLVLKANIASQVHRRVPLDLFIVPQMEDGKTKALSVHAGVWTSAALNTPPSSVPRLRRQLSGLADRLGIHPDGHAGKALVHALTTLPHDLLVGFAPADVQRVATTMMGLVDNPRPRLTLAEGALSRHLFAFVWLPRDMISTQVRLRIIELLEEASGGTLLDWSLHVEGGTLATLRFVFDVRGSDETPDADALEEQLGTMLRGWNKAVENALADDHEAGRAAALAARFAPAFPDAYRSTYGAKEAATDISRLRALAKTDNADEPEEAPARRRDARLYRLDGDAPGRLRLKIYQLGGELSLSDAVPALENFGFRVLGEVPSMLEMDESAAIHDFILATEGGSAIAGSKGEERGDDAGALLSRADSIERAITGVLRESAEDDVFNRLVSETGLAAGEVQWLRAFYRYLRQTGMGFTIYTVVDALRRAPDVTRALVDLLAIRHDPDFDGDREKAEEKTERQIRDALASVVAINDDRLLRLYHGAIRAILRTNAFAPSGDEAIAFKFDSAQVPGLPAPVPWREIFVYSRRVEGIHLRAGPVARGGLRWSDRRDDFRTEVLGLMKAQRVKNAVIVPTGAKGGFYPKQLPDPGQNRDAWAAEGQASYEVFIRSLLSVTDNIVDDKVVHPDRVVIRDGDDPYFVVAADKGTAKFSDIANGIAQKRDFWLGDAFASGGSNGYDHKAMGITARGAWISVQRHFLEMGVDVQSEPVRVAGCGDMSGDVFGNGMLLSKAIKLVAAFDHRHIFIDPDPDPAKSWKERKRVFDLPRSSWEDYDEALISKGGGVFPRSMKQIPLSAQMRRMLATDAKEIDPDTLISAILKADVDLLWFGGIGTYIKAETQNHVEVGDPANDAVRVNAHEVGAKVIGEGANLGITQAGRIAFALEGGRINTDFIDNSAGVDSSDKEVNIKIALAAAMRAGDLDEKARNSLLSSMTDEVADLVLEDNRLQALALSIAQTGGDTSAASLIRVIEMLEDRGELDRHNEGLGSNESYVRRAAEGQGLTRPELAVLLSSAKLALQDAIENCDLADDDLMTDLLLTAFPEPMRDDYRERILNHRLRRELVATRIANLMVNRLGITTPFEIAEEEGAGLSQVAAAFIAAMHLFELEEVWQRLDDAKMNEDARLTLFKRSADALRGQIADVLRAGGGDVCPSQIVDRLAKPVAALSSDTDELLAAQTRQHSAQMRADFTKAGAPEKEAAMVAHLFDLDGAAGIASLAVDVEIEPRVLTNAFTLLGSRLGLDWAQGTAAMMNPSDPWERLLVAGLARDFQQMRLEFLRRLARRKNAREDLTAASEEWLNSHAEAVQQFGSMIARAQSNAPVAPAVLAQIASQARNLLQR